MAREGRNLVATVFKNFINSLKPRRFRGDLIGKDHLGNKYYEIPGATKASTSRWFEPEGGEKNFDQELPAEWESWLRGRRRSPPSVEEVEKNLELMKIKQENAAAIDAEFKTPETVQPPADKVPFPRLDGYEVHPGGKKS